MTRNQTNRREPEYKQLAFETAIRNPERYKDILSFMKKYNGVLLNDNNLLNIVSEMYREGIVTSSDFNLDNYSDDLQLKEAVKRINSSRRADGGFPQGYQSRFWTYMRTLSEFGFVYSRYNEKFVLGDVALKLIDNKIDPQEAFSVQAMKYNRRSPYKNVSNDYNYFIFIINVLKRLKEKGKKLSYNQFVVSLFSKDGNADEFLNIIEKNTFSDKQLTYEFLKNNYLRVNKFGTVMQDYPDVVLRMLRITGFVNLDYKGILLIELNENNLEYIDKLLKFDYKLNNNEKNDAQAYFNKLEKVTDSEMDVILSNREETDELLNYNNTLSKIISEYKLNDSIIINNLDNLCNNSRTDERFKYIADPLKLEFFLSLLMYIMYGDKFKIKPNYKIDANGIPISHAPGNVGDIEITNSDIYWLLEVTLIRNKTQQMNNETINLFRHINRDIKGEKYLSLVAPYIHQDTEALYNTATIQMMSEGMSAFYAKPYNIDDFIKISKSKRNLDDMQQYSNLIKRKIIELANSLVD